MEVNEGLYLKGENWDDIPIEELWRRADGLPPRRYYECIDTRSLLEKHPVVKSILFYIIGLTIVLSVVNFCFIN